MQVTETTKDSLRHAFKIVVPAADIDSKIENRLKELAREIKLPGFRVGKAPLSLMRQRYTEAAAGEVLQQSVRDSVRQALEERSLAPAMDPKTEILTFGQGQDLAFTVELDVLPEVERIDFATIELAKPKAVITDADVDDALARLARQHRTLAPVTAKREAKEKDIVEIDFVGLVDGAAFPGGEAKGVDLELGSGMMVPGFEDQLLGAKVGDVVDVVVTLPQNDRTPDISGKDARFSVTVKALKTAKVPPIDDAFAQSVGVDSLDALKKSARAQLEDECEKLTLNKVKRELLDKLEALAKFDIPQSLVDAELAVVASHAAAASRDNALDEEERAKTKEEMDAYCLAIAQRRVRLALLLADVGQRGAVKVSEQDLHRALAGEIAKHPGREQEVLTFFKNNKGALERLRAPIYEDKVLEYIIALVKPAVKEMTVAELTSA